MRNIDRINKEYEIVPKGNLLMIKKNSDKNFKVVLPSKSLRLYFMFGEEFNAETVEELIKAKKVIKITAYELYKTVFDNGMFSKSIEEYIKFKIESYKEAN